MLTGFCFVCHSNDRESWYSVYTSYDDGRLPRHSTLSVPLARRLADKLCDKYGITDRGGLMCGFWMTVPAA